MLRDKASAYAQSGIENKKNKGFLDVLKEKKDNLLDKWTDKVASKV